MAQVKFYRGSINSYLPSTTHKDSIYFATDTNQLLLNDAAYGVSSDDAAILSTAVTGVEWVTPDTIKFTRGNGKEYSTVTFPAATETAQGLMTSDQVVKLKNIADGAQVNVIEDVVIDGVGGTVTDKTLTITAGFAKAADVYTKTEADEVVDGKIASAVSSVYKYKGSVSNYSDLPTEGQANGDVYNVENGWDLYPAGTNVAWNDVTKDWDPLGGPVDLTKVESDIKANADAIAANSEAITAEKERAEGVEGELRTDLGTKADEANKDGSAFARIANLVDLVSDLTGGSTESVGAQINNAITALKGDATINADTLGELEDLIEAEAAKARAAEAANTDAIAAEKTRAEGEEAKLAASIATLNGADTVEGSVAKQVKDAVAGEAELREAADSALDSRIAALEHSVGTEGSVTEAIQANADAIAAHIADKTVHITAEERTAWNAAEQNAKDYADSLADNYDAAGAAAAVQDKLNEEVDRAKAAEKANSDAITALQTVVNDNESDIEGKVSALAARVSTNETNIATNTDNIASNLEQINAIDTAYKAADTALETKLVGTASDATDANTINGVRNYVDYSLEWHEA